MAVKGGDVIFNFKSNDKELQKSVSQMGTSIKKMVTALGLDKLISKTMSALNNSLDGAIKRVDTLNNFPKVMSNLGIATEDATASINELSDGLIGLPTTLNDAVGAVQRFTSKNNDVKQSTKMFLALNNAILAGGASTELQTSALEQLSQAYAKGKPDAMEWRSMLTAMPAQLKQVAKYMGYTSTAVGGDLYNAIQKGKVSMDDFMGAIINLNEKGVGEFASFAEQAKSSTGGIATSITNVKTAITRGLANSIEALNKALKNANLPTINDMIQKAGTTISKAFNKVNESIGKIKFEKLIPVVKDVVKYFNNLKSTMLGFVKEVFKKIDWNMVLKIAPTILKIVGTIKILNPLIKTGTSLISGFSGVVKGLTSPVGLATAVITGLATAFTFLANNQTEEQRQMREFREEVVNSKKELDEFNDSVDANMAKSLAQIDHTKALSDELKTLVDENGKVKEGYEDRVKFILGQLNDALGTEMKLNGKVIENYQDMQKEIDKLVEKKRAEIILNSEQEKYKKAIEKRTEAYENMKKIVEQTGMTFDEVREKIKQYNEMDDFEKVLNSEWMETYGNSFQDLERVVDECTENIKQYESDYALFTQNKFDEIGTTITTSTKDWTDATAEQMQKDLAEKENSLKANLELFKAYNEEKHKNDVNNGLKDLALLRSQLETRTNTVSRMSQSEIEAFIRLAQNDRKAFDDILGQTSGDTKKQLEAIAGVIDQNGSIPEKEIEEVADYMTYQFTSMNGRKWGDDMVQGIINGIRNKQAAARQVANQLASIIASPLHFSRPDEGALRNYEKWMPDFIQGLKKSLEIATPNLYGAISKMAGQMKDQLSLGFGMSPTLNNVSSYSPSINVKVINNMETDFMGNLVSNIKTFSNGSKNDYNYGMGG